VFGPLTPTSTNATGFGSLRITINSSNGPIFVAASIAQLESTISGLHALEGDTDSDAELTMSFGGPQLFGYSTSKQGDILEDVFSMLPISNIDFFSISVSGFVPSVNWYELSQRCEKVTTIRASGRGTSGLLRFLAPLKPTQTSKGKEGRCVNRATRTQGGHQYRRRARGRYTISEADVPVVGESGLYLRRGPVWCPVPRHRVRSQTAQGEQHAIERAWP